jgi:hypothetical protein
MRWEWRSKESTDDTCILRKYKQFLWLSVTVDAERGTGISAGLPFL